MLIFVVGSYGEGANGEIVKDRVETMGNRYRRLGTCLPGRVRLGGSLFFSYCLSFFLLPGVRIHALFPIKHIRVFF